MSTFPKLKSIHQTKFPEDLTDVIIKYFTIPIPTKNFLLTILKKLNVFNPQTLPKSSKKSSGSNSPIIITFFDKSANDYHPIQIPADSPFSLKGLSKSQIESIEKSLSSEASYKQKDFKSKNPNKSMTSVFDTFGLKNSISEYSNNTDFIYLFRTVDTLIEFFYDNNLQSQDFLMTIEPLFPLLYRYLIRLLYQFQNLFKQTEITIDILSEDLYFTSSLVIRTFLKLTSVFDIINETKPQANTDFDFKAIHYYELEAFQLLSLIYQPLILSLQNHYSNIIYQKITPYTTFLREVSQMSLNSLIKRNTLLIHQSDPTINLFLPFEIYQFLLTSCTHCIYYCFNEKFLKQLVNKVISILMAILKFDKRIVYSSFTENGSIGFILFSPVVDIFQIALKTLISIPEYESNSEKQELVDNKDVLATFGNFILKNLILIYNYCEDSTDLMDYLKANEFVELIRDYFEYNMKIFADEIITGLNNLIKTGKLQINEEIDCNVEFPVQTDFSTIGEISFESTFTFIQYPSNEISDIKFPNSIEEYMPSATQGLAFQVEYDELLKLSPSFDKLIHTNVKNNNKSKLLKNSLLMLAPKIVENYSILTDNDDTNAKNAMMIILIVKMLIESSMYLNIELIKKHDLFKKLTDLFVFDSKFYPFVKDINYSHYNPLTLFIYKNARNIIFHYLKENYTNFSYNVIVLILNYIDNLQSLEISNLYFPLLKAIYMSNVSQFLRTSIDTNCIFPLLIKHSFKLQKLFYQKVDSYLKIKHESNEQAKAELKYLHSIHQCRLNQLIFFISLTIESNSNNLFYSNSDINLMIFNFLFENLYSNISLDFIHHGLLLSNLENISKTMNSLLNTLNICIDNANILDNNEIDYLSLILNLTKVLVPSIENNQKVLIETFIRFDFINFLFNIPKRILKTARFENTKEIRMKILNNVFNILSALSFKNSDFQISILPQLFELSDLLQQFNLTDETIESVLKLIFEQELLINNFPEMAEIRFYQSLKFLYLIIENDYKHQAQIYSFIAKIAEKSFVNRLCIFKANLIPLIIDSITQNHFPKDLPIEEMKYRSESIESKWEILQITSASLFMTSSLIQIFHNIKNNNKNKERPWYTSRMIKLFDDIISNDNSTMIGSYFHFKDSKDGIFIPRIDLSTQNEVVEDQQIQNDTEKVNVSGWTFFCHLQLHEDVKDNSCLLSFASPISSKDVTRLQIVFNNKKMIVIFTSPENESQIKKTVEFNFQPMIWYSFLLKIYKNGTLKIFVDRNKIFQSQFKNMKFDKILEQFSIANAFHVPFKLTNNKISFSDTEYVNDILLNIKESSALSCNITCCYLFNKSLSKNNIKNLFQLPVDYNYSFPQSNRNMFRNLPQALYTGETENDLVFCYNPHLTNGKNLLTNIKKNSRVGDALYIGNLIPYNSTVLISSINYGGPKLFLPFFERIDLPIDHSNDITYAYKKAINEININVYDERQEFLTLLISIIAKLCKYTVAENAFSHENGFESLSHLFQKLNPNDWSESSFRALHNLYTAQKLQIHKMKILQGIYFQFPIWKNLSLENQRLFVDICLNQIFAPEPQSKFNQFLIQRFSFIKALCFILCVPENEIRNIYWDFLVVYSRYGLLHSAEKSDLYIMALDNQFNIAKRNRLIGQTQVLRVLFNVVSEKSGDSHQNLINPAIFNQILFLAKSESEIVRFYTLKFLILIKELNNSNQLNKEIPLPIDQAISTYLAMYIPKNLTEYTWNELILMVYDDNDRNKKKRIVELLPVFSAFSSFALNDQIMTFVKLTKSQIEQSFQPFASIYNESFDYCEYFTSSPNWTFNLFYIFMSTHNQIDLYNNELYTLFIEVFRDLFFYLLLTDRTKLFNDSVQSLMMIQYVLKLDTSYFIQLIFNAMIVQFQEFITHSETKLLSKSKYNYMNALTNLISSSFLLLFITTSYEYYYQNKEIIADQAQLIEKIELLRNNIEYCKYISMFQNLNIPKINGVFHVRINDNKWVDQELASSLHLLLETILFVKKNLKLIFVPMCSKQVKLIDIYVLVDVVLKKFANMDLSALHLKLSLYPIKDTIQKNENLIALCIAIYKGRYEKYDSQTQKAFNSLAKILNENANISESNSQSELNNAIQYSAEKYFDFISNLSKNYLDLSKCFTQLSMEINFKPKSIKSAEFPNIAPKYNRFARNIPKNFANIRKIFSTKYTKLRKDLYLNSGLWTFSRSDPSHWKLSAYLDSEYRHIQMIPNRHFNNHIDASIRRDAGNKNAAEEQLKLLQLNENEIAGNETEEEETENETIENSKSFEYQTEAQMITIQGNLIGKLTITSKDICFNGMVDPNTDALGNETEKRRKMQISLSNIRLIFKRNYKHIESAFEIFVMSNCSFFFNLANNKKRKKVFRNLSKQAMPNLKYFQMNDDTIDHPNSIFSMYKITERWQKKEISNYEYLVLLNLYAGRSFNDLTQYPVFPWILSNYSSDTLDLNDPNNYRDLSKPIGALNETRLKSLKDKIEMAKEFDTDDSPDKLPYFLYSTHYSTAYDVVYYLIRVEPYTSIFIRYQGNKFDLAERTFQSISQVWNAINSSQAQYKELIPEMFTTPELLMNNDKFDLGKTTKSIDFETIDYYNNSDDYVQLPPWANNNPYLFIEKHREALESDYVSMHLNEWIDLIFGYKQTGEMAIQADNTFHPYTYSSYLTSQIRKDKEKMKTIQMTIVEFGITPFQILKTNQHPPRILQTLLRDIKPHSVFSKIFHHRRSKGQPSQQVYDEEKYATNLMADNNEGNYIQSFKNRKPIYISGNKKISVILTSNSHLFVYKNNNDKNYKFLSECDLSHFVTFTDMHFKKYKNCVSFYNRLVQLPKQQKKQMNIFVISSYRDVSYYIFSINEEDGSVYHITSYQDRSNISQIITCHNACSFAAVSCDTSISVFSLKCLNSNALFVNQQNASSLFDTNSTEKVKYPIPTTLDSVINLRKIYRVIPHSTKIVDISESNNLNIIISADINKLVLTEMKTGKYLKTISLLNSIQLPKSDQNFVLIKQTIKNILLSEDQPCIIVAAKILLTDKTNTEVSSSETETETEQNLNFEEEEEEGMSLSDIYMKNASFANNDEKFKQMVLIDSNLIEKENEEEDQSGNESQNDQKDEFISEIDENKLNVFDGDAFEDNHSINMNANLSETNQDNNTNEAESNIESTHTSEINPSLIDNETDIKPPQYDEEVQQNDEIKDNEEINESLNENSIKETDEISEIGPNSEILDNEINGSHDILGNPDEIAETGLDENDELNDDVEINENSYPNENNWQEKNQMKILQEIINANSHLPKNDKITTTTILYSFDLSGSLISYMNTNAKIKSWCEVKSNSSEQAKLVVAFDNCTICAYSLPFFEPITTFSLLHNAEQIYYNEERKTIIVIQEGTEYLVFELDLFD